MKLISFDIETWGLKEGYSLQPWRVKTGEGGIICTIIYPKQKYLTDKMLLCGWNVKFDTAWCLTTDPIEYAFKYLDGMLLLKRLFQDLPTYALKPTLEKFKDQIDFTLSGQEYVSGYSDEIEFKIGRLNDAYTKEEIKRLEEYCARDAAYTYAIVRYLITLADINTIRQAIRESSVSVLFADSWQRGLPIDKEEVLKQEKEITELLKKYDALLEKVGLTKEILNSPKQLRDFLCSTWNVKLTKLTPKGDYSVDASVLKDLMFENEGVAKKLLRVVIKRKELQTEYDKFISAALECLKESDVIHPEPMMNSTYTGRMTYSVNQTITKKTVLKNGKTRESKVKVPLGLPIHQMKRGELRKIFIAPKGYKLVELDFSAQEMRLMADIANEKTMIEFFNSGKDLHAYTAANIYDYGYEEFQKLKVTDKYKEMRQLGKITNLSLQYRLSSKNLYRVWHDKYDLVDKKLQDAERARNVYLEIYQGIPQYWKEIIDFAQPNGYVANMAGRKHLLKDWTGDKEWQSQQTAINFPIQSTGAEQKILALYELRKFLIKESIQLAWDLHDGMYFFIPDCMMTNDLVLEMIDIVNNIDYEKAWGWKPKVKFPVEAKIGDNWGELKSFC
jgi:DNA polymerase I